jgi:hypothetical protein
MGGRRGPCSGYACVRAHWGRKEGHSCAEPGRWRCAGRPHCATIRGCSTNLVEDDKARQRGGAGLCKRACHAARQRVQQVGRARLGAASAAAAAAAAPIAAAALGSGRLYFAGRHSSFCACRLGAWGTGWRCGWRWEYNTGKGPGPRTCFNRAKSGVVANFEYRSCSTSPLAMI